MHICNVCVCVCVPVSIEPETKNTVYVKLQVFKFWLFSLYTSQIHIFSILYPFNIYCKYLFIIIIIIINVVINNVLIIISLYLDYLIYFSSF